MNTNLDEFEKKINYIFIDRSLLKQALTHRSCGAINNERLEFLGDSVLNLVITIYLYNKKKYLNEGDLHRLRAKLVCEENLFQIALNISLDKYVNIGPGEKKIGGNKRKSTLADALEAVLGAVYIDSGLRKTNDVIDLIFEQALKKIDLDSPGKDPKSELQEILQMKGMDVPKYEITSKSGADHNQTFEVRCLITDLNISTFGFGNSRKAAEVAAALKIVDIVKRKLK